MVCIREVYSDNPKTPTRSKTFRTWPRAMTSTTHTHQRVNRGHNPNKPHDPN